MTPSTSQTERPAADRSRSAVPLRIFVVDDDAGVRSAIGDLAGASGDCVVWDTAASGEEALQRLADCHPDDRPDVVLLDVELPGIDGLEVTRRRLTDDPVTPIVLMSTHDEDDLPLAGLGAAAFVPKIALSPAALSGLRRVVDR